MRVRLSTHLLSFCRLSQGANESISSFYSFRNRFRFVISLLVILLFEKKKKNDDDDDDEEEENSPHGEKTKIPRIENRQQKNISHA